MDLTLKRINSDIDKEWQFVRNMPVDENGLGNKWHGISKEQYIQEAVPEMIYFQNGKDLPEGMVPETFLFLWNDNEIIGQYRLRHFLNDALRDGSGHISYFIAKEFRNKGYGTKGLYLLLEFANRIVPEDEFYLRVNRDNPASLKVMLNNGGRVVSEDIDKYYVRIPK